MEEQQHIFTNKMLRTLLIPVIFEQVLNSLMGTVDTMMVSNVGSAALSAVSLVDSINVLLIQAFSALAAGGAIVCAQYIGQRNYEKANMSARQVLFIITAISVVVSAVCLIFQKPLLRLIFGAVDADVMRASETYFFFTALSFPFIAAYDSAASIFRAQENTKGPMAISMISNIMNIGGNAVLIWVFHLGVAGAAISTLVSRIFCAVVVLWQLRKDRQPVVVKDYLKIRPDWSMIGRILGLGIPSGIENSMFQLGKLAIQSTVSTLGTAAIAAQAMTNILENLNGIAAIGVGVGLMTIVGQCLGAGRKDEAVYYIKKLSVIAEVAIIDFFTYYTPGAYVGRRRARTINPRTVTAARIIKEYAQEHKMAVWDMYNIVGGKTDACRNWTKHHMFRADGIHFTPDGYRLQGNLLHQALIKAYNEYVATGLE